MAENAAGTGSWLRLSGLDDRRLLCAGGAVSGGLLALYAVAPSSWTVLRGLVLVPLAGALAVVFVVVGVRRYRPVAPRAWLLIGAGLGLFTLGFVVTGWYEVVQGYDPYPSVAEVFYLTAYPLLAGGLIAALRVRQDAGVDPLAGIDAGIVAAVGALLAWVYVVRPALASGELSTAAALASLIYVIADLLTFMIALRFLMVTNWRHRSSLSLLAAGFAATLIGDMSYLLWAIYGRPSVRFWEVALAIGLVAIGVAALDPTMRALTEETESTGGTLPGRGRVVLIAGAGLVPPVLLAVREWRGEPLYATANIVVWMALSVLIAARFYRGGRTAQHEADREAALSRYAADLLAAGERDQILAVACRALTALSETGDAEARLVLPGEPPPPAGRARTDIPVTVRGEQAAVIVASGAATSLQRWRPSLGAIANQLSLALERDDLLAAEQATTRSLAEQNERLRELDAMKDSFVSSVSHELRTPLTSMVGFLEILRDGEVGELNPDQAHMVEIIERNSHRLEHLIGDILVAARFDSGRMRFDMDFVDLGALAGRQVESIAATATAQGTRVRLDVDPDVPAVWGDAERLGQMIDNLLSNAVKFTPGGTVTVTVGRQGDRAVLAVADTGVGMPAEDLDKVFDRFYRASTAGTTQGTGLGLSITRSIAEAHGGTIGVTSEVGVGTTFRVELALAAGDPAPADDHHEVTT
jgi:signal transduction histidine kinase